MSGDDVRSRVAERIASEAGALDTSALGRGAGWVGALARAGAKSVTRAVRRAVGQRAADVAPEAEVAASLGQLKGPMMKVGQLLGYVDLGLPDGLRAALSALHTSAPALDTDRIHRVLDEDFGDPGRALARTVERRALSSASVGQVHRATLPDGTPVVIKVQHPGLPTVIQRDLGPVLFASRISAPLHTLVAQIRDRLLEECDYDLEARRQARFREILAGHPTLVIPPVHAEYSSARVLTSTFADGVHIDRYLASGPSHEARTRAGEALFDFYFAPLFHHGVYNGDAHPGNYLFLRDGRVAVVDFGCTREFAPDFVARLAWLVDAVVDANLGKMNDALVDLGLARDVAYDREATQRLLYALLGPLARDEVLAFDPGAEITLRGALASLWKARRLAISAEPLFLLRTLLGLSSVLARLGARANWRRRLDAVVETSPLVTEANVARATPGRVVTSVGVIKPITSSRRNVRETSWDVVLVEVGQSPIAVLRELRQILRRDLRDLEALLDSAPETLRRELPRVDAESLRNRLESAGARVEVRRAACGA